MIFGFIALLSSLARVADLTKCLFLNDEPFFIFLIDIKLKKCVTGLFLRFLFH